MINLAEYDISRSTGFVPEKFPVECLPQDYYQPWESLVENLPALILNKSIRRLIDTTLPVLSTEHLANEGEVRRAYVVLSFLTHAYVWSFDCQPVSSLPPQLSTPYTDVASQLGLPPVATYAALVLWNFKPALKSPGQTYTDVSKLTIDNFSTVNTFTGSIDEMWFYLISVQFEIEGAKCLDVGMKAATAAAQNRPEDLTTHLRSLAELLDNLGSVLLSMEDMCDPHVFYFRIRPFLAGWKNMREFGLPSDGIIYGTGEPQTYSGGSNAQSSLIQYFDTLLGVVHHPTGVRPGNHGTGSSSTLTGAKSSLNNKENNFMEQMKFYMPEKHRTFLDALSEESVIREYVNGCRSERPELVLAYDACLAMLKSFRDKHIQIVTRYIILPSRAANNSKTLRIGLASNKKSSSTVGLTEETGESGGARGTGGTALLPFLKQCRDETGDPAAGSWGRRILTGGILNLKYTNRTKKNVDNIKKEIHNPSFNLEQENEAGHW
ncbi:dioxygenase [Saccharomycopsis crataegensis]|uniref:Indoleamine 2,3-dioxygenase n=1 Tax=Saccharomycopsis crataegensis TaxID=43959 RepID=A0AAV5QUR1_9ASCO|nr:dioxygenase [Saccharomycopsis crataegensis]